MSKSLKKMFDDKDYTFELLHEVINHSIGYYEYWGARFYDKYEDFVRGTVYIVFKGDFTEEAFEGFVYENFDDITDVLLDYPPYENIENEDCIQVDYKFRNDGVVKIYLDFTAD